MTTPTRRRAKDRVETPEMADAVVRMVRALGARASEDVDALPELARVALALDVATHGAVAGCRERGWSYTDVGRVLGITRQAAFQRFGR